MSMGQVLLGLFAAYLLYNFIFRFIIPLVRVTRQVKRQVRDFQQHVNTQPGDFGPSAPGRGFPGATSGHYQAGGLDSSNIHTGSSQRPANANKAGTAPKTEPYSKKDDYIDFEEIK